MRHDHTLSVMGNVSNVAYQPEATDMTNVTAKTKIDARAESATLTAVTINWDNTSLDDIKALATRTIVIAAQSGWRKDGAVPAEVTLDANDYANPTRAPRKPADIKALFAKMTAEERAEFLASIA